MRVNLSKTGSTIVQSLRLFPMEALAGFFFFIMFCIQEGMSYRDVWNSRLDNMLSLFPAFIVLIYALHRLCKGNLRFLYYLSTFLFIPFLWVDLESFVYSYSYFFTLLLSAFVLLACKCKWDNPSFARNSLQTVVDLVVAFFTGHVLSLTLWAIYSSVIYIFNVDDAFSFAYIYMFILLVVIPVLFCHLQEKESEAYVPRFMEIILNYILSPGVIIYTGILYLYCIVITLKWELPKGGIGYMVLAFVICAMAGRMSQQIVSKRFYDWYYNSFSWIAFPPLVLFWIGTIERISTYGFTDSRVYLLASGLLMTLYIFFLFFKRLANYQLMAILSMGCIVLLTYIPGISAESIGIYSQEQRMVKYIHKLDMLDATTQKLKKGVKFSAVEDSLKWNDSRELKACYDYLERKTSNEYMESKYGACDFVFEDGNGSLSLYLNPKSGIDINGYTHFYPFENTGAYTDKLDDKGILTVSRIIDNKVVLRYNVDSCMNQNTHLISGYEDRVANTDLLVTRNDSCLLIIGYIYYTYDGTKYHCNNLNINTIITK